MKSGKLGPTKKRLKSQGKRGRKRLDTFSSAPTNQTIGKRGRHSVLPWETVTGRASNYEYQLNENWEKLEIPLLSCKTPHEVTEAFKKYVDYCAGDFVPALSADIFLLLNDPDFPQRPLPRTRFLGRSLAGRPHLSFRRSRDICEEADRREKRKSPHRIVRRELYIECSCGYRGPARNDGCRKCGAQLPPSFDFLWTGEALEIDEVKRERKIRKQTQPELHPEAAIAANPNTVRCGCGTTIAAANHEMALEMLAKHKRDQHPEIANQPPVKPPE